MEQWRDHPLNAVDGTMKDKAKRLRELAAEGDELALQLFDDQARAMGISLLMINYIGDYDLLVIGGGVCDLTPDMLEAGRDRALDHGLLASIQWLCADAEALPLPDIASTPTPLPSGCAT